MKVNMNMERKMVKESLFGLMDLHTKVISKIIIFMDTVFTNGQI